MDVPFDETNRRGEPRLSPTRRIPIWLVLVLGLCGSCWPWVQFLGFEPMSTDAALWMSRGSLSNPDWLQWTLLNQHFVGYRPVNAVSFSLNFLLGGLEPFVYRLTNTLLHMFVAMLLYVLLCRLARVRPWAAVLAAWLFAAHPGADDVVPYLARRSYLLSSLLGLLGLLLLHRSLEQVRRWSWLFGRSLCVGLLLAASFLSNEVGVANILIAPLLAWLAARRHSQAVVRLLCSLMGTLLLMATALIVRASVVEGLGGYPADSQGLKTQLGAFLASWRSLTVSHGASHGLVTSMILLGLVAPYYTWRSLLLPMAQRLGNRHGTRLVLGLWLIGYSGICASQSVWFPRQVYPMLIPAALLIADILEDTIHRLRKAPRSLLMHLIPQVLLVGQFLVHSPVLHGPEQERVRSWESMDMTLTALREATQNIGEPAVLYLVLSYQLSPPGPGGFPPRTEKREPPRVAKLPVHFVSGLVEHKGVRVKDLVYFDRGPDPSPEPNLVIQDDEVAVQVPENCVYYVRENRGLRRKEADTSREVLIPLEPNASSQYIFIWNRSGGRLTALR